MPVRLKIVCFGDSTTAERLADGAQLNVYANILRDELPYCGVYADVINSGIPGDNTCRAIERFGRDVMEHEPDMVVVQFGINDSWADDSIERVSRVSAGQYRSNLSFLVSALRENGSDIVLMTPNPLGKAYEKWRYDRLHMYAETVREISIDHNTMLMDVWSIYKDYSLSAGNDRDDLLLDGMHPNGKGHRLIGDALKTLICGHIT